MKALVGILVLLTATAFAHTEHSEMPEQNPTAPEMHKGANLNLFPPPQADVSKSTRPVKPELVEPAYHAKLNAGGTTLKWNAVPNADAYHIQVATDPNFKWLVANQEVFQGTTFEVKGIEAGKHYFWRVAALKTDNDPTFMKGWYSLSTFDVQ